MNELKDSMFSKEHDLPLSFLAKLRESVQEQVLIEKDRDSEECDESLACCNKDQEDINKETLSQQAIPPLENIDQRTSTELEANSNIHSLSSEELEKIKALNLQEGDTCPICKAGILLLKHTEKGDFLGCSIYPRCKFTLFLGRASQVETLMELSSKCPLCQEKLTVKKGRFGIFIGCSNYPSCTFVHKEEEEIKEVIPCPICKKGEIRPRKTKKGSTFYGCTHYPNCDFLLQGLPVQKACEECNFPLHFKRKTKKGTALICGNQKCSSRRKRKLNILEKLA